MAEALEGVERLSEADRATLCRLRHQASSLALLAQDVLAAGRLETGHFRLRCQMIDLGALVATVADLLPDAERVRVEVPPAPVVALVDSDRIMQAVGNLLRNALQYSPRAAPVRIVVEDSGEEACIAVHDAGPGLSAPQIAQLFQKYERLDSADDASGTGLGLYLTRLLVESHGGRVEAASGGPGRGATLRIVLPRAGRDNAPRAAGDPRDTASPVRS